MKTIEILKKIGIAGVALALLALALLWLLSPIKNSNTYSADGYDYELVGNGFQSLFGTATVRITGCSGDEEEVVFPSTIAGKRVTEIGSRVFNEFGEDELSVKSVVIPEGVTTIGQDAFDLCKTLTHVTIPDSVTEIGTMAFMACESLTDITIPGGVKKIGFEAFFHCMNLKTVTFSEGLTHIDDSAFDGTAIEELDLPKSVTEIAHNAFDHRSLKRITVAEGNPVYHSAGNCLIETATKTLVIGCVDSTIPDDGSVTIIGDHAFGECDTMTEIVIPKGITTIGYGAFSDCGLTEAVIPEGVTTIDGYAFMRCHGLKKLTLPKSLTSIGDGLLYCIEGEVEIVYAGGEAGRANLTIGENNLELENAKWTY